MKMKTSLVVAGVALAAVFGARAYAQNSSACSLSQQNTPANGQTKTFQAQCQHQSAGRGASNATFTAQTTNNVTTFSVSMSCCTGMNAVAQGVDANFNPIPSCVAVASPGAPASVSCTAPRWNAGMLFIE